LEILPQQIEELEKSIDEINRCLYDPECYQERGLVELSAQLEEYQKSYDELSDRYLEVLELEEELNS